MTFSRITSFVNPQFNRHWWADRTDCSSSFSGLLRIHCKTLLKQLQTTFESWVTPHIQCKCNNGLYQGNFQSCEHLVLAGLYLKCLSRHGFWPISNIQTYSIFRISCIVGGLERREVVSPGQVYMEQILKTAVHDVDKKVTGLFLSCVRNGVYIEKEDERHTDLNCCCLSKDSTQQGDESLEGH